MIEDKSINTDEAKKNDCADETVDFRTVYSGINKFATLFGQGVQKINRFFEDNRETIIRSLGKIMSFFAGLEPGFKKIFAHFAERGWYYPIIDDVQITELLRLISLEDDELNDYMVKHTQRFAESIIQKTCDKYPDRENIIRTAYCAHCEGDYELSVPVFLIQADGIAFNMFGTDLYGKPKNEKVTRVGKKAKKDLEDKDLDFIEENYLDMLLMITSINRNEKEERQNRLNRHKVLHGKDTEYATLTNSCKGIMLFDYLNKLHEIFINKSDDGNSDNIN